MKFLARGGVCCIIPLQLPVISISGGFDALSNFQQYWKLRFVETSLQIFKKNGSGFRTLSFVWDESENKKMFFFNDFYPLTAWFFCIWYIMEIFHGYIYIFIMVRRTFVFSKSEMGVLERGVGYVWNKVNDEDTKMMSMV